MIGRFIRLHPIQWHNEATVRMEFYGCELDGMIFPVSENRNVVGVFLRIYFENINISRLHTHINMLTFRKANTRK